jgi:hypothetical protein
MDLWVVMDLSACIYLHSMAIDAAWSTTQAVYINVQVQTVYISVQV